MATDIDYLDPQDAKDLKRARSHTRTRDASDPVWLVSDQYAQT